MSDPKDKDFNETLKRLMEKDPKPHEEMKKGRQLKAARHLPPPPPGLVGPN